MEQLSTAETAEKKTPRILGVLCVLGGKFSSGLPRQEKILGQRRVRRP